MNAIELKKLYRRIERGSRLRTNTWFKKLTTLLSSLF